MKKKIIKFMAITLCGCILSSSVYGCYTKSNNVDAAFVIDDTALFIIMMLGVAGTAYVGTQHWNVGDDFAYPDEVKEAEETLARLWNNALIAHGYVDSNGNLLGNNNDDPENEPPNWEKLKEWFVNHKTETLLLGETALGVVATTFANDLKKETSKGTYFDSSVDVSIYEKHKDVLESYPYTFFLQHIRHKNEYTVYCLDTPIALYKSGSNIGWSSGAKFKSFLYANGVLSYSYGLSQYPEGGIIFYDEYIILPGGNIPLYDSVDAVPDSYFMSTSSVLNNNSVVYSSNLTEDENSVVVGLPIGQIGGGFSSADVEKFTQSIGNAQGNVDAIQSATDTLISSIEKTSSDTGTDVNPDDETGSGTGSGTGTDTGTDNRTDEEIAEDLENNTLTDDAKGLFLLPEGIKDKFPFCVPFDIIRAFSVLSSDTRTAPKLSWPIKVERLGIDSSIEVDLSIFDEQAELLRKMELLLFIVGLAFASRGLIKG